MMHGRAKELRDRWRRPGARWRLLLALFVMLAAVMPHLTLSAAQPAGIAIAGVAAERPAEARADGAQPCHEQPSKHSGAATLPACCVIGCGLAVDAQALVLPFRTVAWARLQLPEVLILSGISREPAKPPPRSEPVLL